MDIKNRTKYVFAETLLQLLKYKDLEKITIKEICDHCHADRKTFYNHFENKYSLAGWLLNNYAYQYFSDDSIDKDIHATKRYYSYLKNNLEIYRRIFKDPGISDLLTHLVKWNMDRYLQGLQDNNIVLSEKDYYRLKLYVYGGINITREWIINGCKEDAAFIAEVIALGSPSFLRDIIL